MPDGGTLAIETGTAMLDEAGAEKRIGLEAGASALIGVGDTGCGMERERRARRFEPFFSTKGKENGTGLGLGTPFGIAKRRSPGRLPQKDIEGAFNGTRRSGRDRERLSSKPATAF